MNTLLWVTCCLCFVPLSLADPLLLTPLVKAGKFAEARDLSKVHYEDFDFGYSAFFTVPTASKKNSNNIYFWFQPCTDGCSPSSTEFFLWLQGGPGGPGTFGALSEIGNYWIDEHGKPNERCFSWCKSHNCLFVDQPVQTGFSYQLNATGQYDPDHIEYTQYSSQAMEQIYELLVQFFQVWPEYQPAPFYIAGESYGGLYTAWMGYTIYVHNKKLTDADTKINFVGLAVGDPIINWKYQMPTYPDTLYGMGVIMDNERTNLVQIFKNAVDNLEVNCSKAFGYWNSVWNDNGGGGAPGLYYEYTGSSMTEDVILGGQPAAFGYQVNFFQKPDVRKALHIDGIPSSSFNEGGLVYSTMVDSGDFCTNSSWIFATLFLEVGIDLMIYTSTSDPLLGPPTTEAGVAAMFDYAAVTLPDGVSAKKTYDSTKKIVWRIDEKDIEPAGYAKCIPGPHKNRFCITLVRNGGHELPAFQPRSAFDMIMRFIEGRSFDKSGNRPTTVPSCPPCGGVPPFAGSVVPACVCHN